MEQEEHIDYNSLPVYYCKNCLSLKILDIDPISQASYCDDCGSTEIAVGTIEDWESLYELKYKHKYVETKKTI